MVEDRAVKGQYTRLLLILTRCSRLLVTQEKDLFAPSEQHHPEHQHQGQQQQQQQPAGNKHGPSRGGWW